MTLLEKRENSRIVYNFTCTKQVFGFVPKLCQCSQFRAFAVEKDVQKRIKAFSETTSLMCSKVCPPVRCFLKT